MNSHHIAEYKRYHDDFTMEQTKKANISNLSMTNNKLVILFIILLFTLRTASADVIWEDQGEVTLKMGDKYNLDPYTLQISDIDRESAIITVYKYDKIFDTWVLKNTEDFEFNDEIKINRTEIFPGASGFTSFHILKAAVPDFVISFSTEKDTYSPGYNIPVTININNNGNITAKNITVTLDTGELELITGEVEKHYDSINAKTQVSYSVTVATPRLPKKSTFTLIITASGFDDNNTNYKGYGSKSLTVLSTIFIEKTIEGKKFDDVPYIYWGIPANVSIKVKNFGENELKGIKVDDSVTDEFEPLSLSFPSFDLPAGKDKIISYTIIPKKPGRYTLEKANVSFILDNEKIKLESEKQELIVGGAYVQLTKSNEILDENGLVQITVTAQNIGDIKTNTSIIETLPSNVKLIGSASLTRNVTLEPGEKEIISYLAMVPAKIDLPPAKIEYNNLNFESNKLQIILPENKNAQPALKVNELITKIPVDMSYFPMLALSAFFGITLLATMKNGRYAVSFTIEHTSDRKVISTSLGMAILIISLFLLITFIILKTQDIMEDKYASLIIYLLVIGSIIRYVETKRLL